MPATTLPGTPLTSSWLASSFASADDGVAAQDTAIQKITAIGLRSAMVGKPDAKSCCKIARACGSMPKIQPGLLWSQEPREGACEQYGYNNRNRTNRKHLVRLCHSQPSLVHGSQEICTLLEDSGAPLPAEGTGWSNSTPTAFSVRQTTRHRRDAPLPGAKINWNASGTVSGLTIVSLAPPLERSWTRQKRLVLPPPITICPGEAH